MNTADDFGSRHPFVMQVKAFSLKEHVIGFDRVNGVIWKISFYFDRSALVSCLILALILESV